MPGMSGLTMREEDALRRRLDRHVKWGEAAREMARDMLSDDPLVRMVAEGWWRQQLDMPRVVLSLADVRDRLKGRPQDGTTDRQPSPREEQNPLTTGDE